jgi:hypothetical protein
MSDCTSQISAEESANHLFNFLKTGAERSAEHLENNKQIEGLQPAAYTDPPARKERDGTSDDYWGQEPNEEKRDSQTAAQHSNAVWDGFKAGREKFLANNFNSFSDNQDQTEKQTGALLDHARTGDFESSSPYLRDKSTRNPAVVATVFDKTKKLLDQ